LRVRPTLVGWFFPHDSTQPVRWRRYGSGMLSALQILREQVRCLDVARHCLDVASSWVAPEFMFLAFSFRKAAVSSPVAEEFTTFHETTTMSLMASCGTPRRPSSRLSSRMSPIASARLERHSFATALAVRSRHFGTVADKPFAIFLDNGSELVSHDSILRAR